MIYKPRIGERPLWDFPEGTLSQREVAARVVAESLGWHIVPPTVWRDGPFGPGMVQEWIDVDLGVDPVQLVQSDDELLRRIAVFDALINNGGPQGRSPTPRRQRCGVGDRPRRDVCSVRQTAHRAVAVAWGASFPKRC